MAPIYRSIKLRLLRNVNQAGSSAYANLFAGAVVFVVRYSSCGAARPSAMRGHRRGLA
jgi:hypothetical protein